MVEEFLRCEVDEVPMLSSEQRQKLQALCAPVFFDVAMAGYSTFKAGGQAAALVDVQDVSQMKALLRYCRRESITWRVIGRGSNILVSDTGFDGVLFRLAGDFRTVHRAEETGPPVVFAGGGCLLAELLGWCRLHALGGIEFLAGIPGGVGGAVRMNAGAFSRSIGEFLCSISVVNADGELQEKKPDEITLGYRHCAIGDCDMEQVIILSAGLKLQAADSEQVREKMRDYVSLRKDKQPLTFPSAGSFFKNPEGDYAGRLIEAAGLKGVSIGGAMVSPAHANFIVNVRGEATASDIIDLMHKVQEKVMKQTGIFLEPEVHIF